MKKCSNCNSNEIEVDSARGDEGELQEILDENMLQPFPFQSAQIAGPFSPTTSSFPKCSSRKMRLEHRLLSVSLCRQTPKEAPQATANSTSERARNPARSPCERRKRASVTSAGCSTSRITASTPPTTSSRWPWRGISHEAGKTATSTPPAFTSHAEQKEHRVRRRRKRKEFGC
jgi:hypothetical protein